MRVSNIILRVTDMEQSVRFYRDEVGLPLLSQSPTFSFFDGGSIPIALNQAGDLAPDESLTEIVLEVDDVEAAHRAMSLRGVEFRIAPRAVMSDGSRSLYAGDFADPDGHIVSITGWVAG